MEHSGTGWVGNDEPSMAARPYHRRWLMDQADALIGFYRGVRDPSGGFHVLDDLGRPMPDMPHELHDTCRMTHCFAAAHLLGRPGAAQMVDHGIAFLRTRHRDAENGGYFWSVDAAGPVRSDKLTYGHAFVLLAASSAGAIGHPEAEDLYRDILATLRARIWDAAAGLMNEGFDRSWQALDGYRGMNSNMHMVEALLAAFDTWGDGDCVAMAMAIADNLINRHARDAGWVIPEHYTQGWQVDRDYEGDPMFRPAGTTPGHSLEWSRLLMQLWHADGRRQDWIPEAARAIFLRAVELGWSEAGGFHYTLSWDGLPARTQTLWWPCAEGAAAAYTLGAMTGDAEFETWYRRIWAAIDARFIDHRNGGWWHEVGADGRPVAAVFKGKPDMYHALQACLIPLLPPERGMITGLRTG